MQITERYRPATLYDVAWRESSICRSQNAINLRRCMMWHEGSPRYADLRTLSTCDVVWCGMKVVIAMQISERYLPATLYDVAWRESSLYADHRTLSTCNAVWWEWCGMEGVLAMQITERYRPATLYDGNNVVCAVELRQWERIGQNACCYHNHGVGVSVFNTAVMLVIQNMSTKPYLRIQLVQIYSVSWKAKANYLAGQNNVLYIITNNSLGVYM